jgi:hypothetical protein
MGTNKKLALLMAEPILAFFVWMGDDIMRIISLVIMAIVAYFAIQAHRSTKKAKKAEEEYYSQKMWKELEDKKKADEQKRS